MSGYAATYVVLAGAGLLVCLGVSSCSLGLDTGGLSSGDVPAGDAAPGGGSGDAGANGSPDVEAGLPKDSGSDTQTCGQVDADCTSRGCCTNLVCSSAERCSAGGPCQGRGSACTTGTQCCTQICKDNSCDDA